MKNSLIFIFLLLYSFLNAQNFTTRNVINQIQVELSKLNYKDYQYYQVLKKLCYISPEEAQKILDKINESELENEALFYYKKTRVINQLNLSNFDKALIYAHEIKEMAEISNDHYKKSISYIWLSECYTLKFHFKDAKLYALKTTNLNQNGKDQYLYLRSIVQLAKINYFEKNFAEAMEACNKALKILELISDSYETSKIYTVLSNIQKDIGNYDLAIFYFNKAIQIDEQTNNYISLSKNLGFLALLYYQIEDYYKALDINKKGIEIAQVVNSKFSIVNKLIIHGNCLLRIGKYDEAIQYYKDGEIIAKSIHFKSGFVWCSIGMIEYNIKIKSYQNAKNIIKSIEYQVDSINQSEMFIPYYKHCANVYANLSDYKKAYEYFQKFYNLIETDLKQNNKNRITQMGVIFQTEMQKKENEFMKQQNEVINNQNQLQKVIIFLIFFLLLISLVFIGYLYKQRNLLNELNFELHKKNDEITAHQEELITQTELVKKQKEELEAIDKYKSQLFAVITHDLKTPIANLQMLLSILEKKQLSKEDINSYIQEIKNEVDNSYELLQNFILWTKSRLINFEPKFKVFFINNLIQKNLIFFENNLSRKNIHIDYEVDEEILVWADEQLLSHVIYNILSNAIKFSPPNNTIKIYGSSVNKDIVINIENFGKPIPPETIQQIFQINSTPEQGTSKEIGTGIGLYLSSEFMKKMNGKITCHSDEKSTIFSVYIPMADD